MYDERQRQNYKASASGHPGWEHEGKPLHPESGAHESESTSAQQNGYASNPLGFPHVGIVNAHGIRR